MLRQVRQVTAFHELQHPALAAEQHSYLPFETENKCSVSQWPFHQEQLRDSSVTGAEESMQNNGGEEQAGCSHVNKLRDSTFGLICREARNELIKKKNAYGAGSRLDCVSGRLLCLMGREGRHRVTVGFLL